MMERIREKKIYIILFLIVVLVKSRNLFVYSFPWAGDSTLTIAGGMWFAGYDWSNYAAHNSYYGFLYPMLLSPLMRVIDNPVILYKSMLLINNFLMGVIAMGVYYISHEKCNISKIYSVGTVIAFLVFEPICLYSDFILSEIPYILWTVSIIIILCGLTEAEESKKNKMSLLLSLVIPLGLLIHSRCIIVWVCLIFIIVIYHLIYKKSLVNYLIIISVCGGGIWLFKIMVSYVQQRVWLAGDGEALVNSVDTVSKNITLVRQLTNIENIKSFITVVGSNISNFIILSFGVFGLALVVLFLLIRYHYLDIILNKSLLIVLIMGITCWGGMITSQSLISFRGISNGEMLKWLVYPRYAAPFVFLIYICMMFYLDKYKTHRIKIVLGTLLLDSLVGKWFLQILLDKLGGQKVGSTTLFNTLLVTAEDYSKITVIEEHYLCEIILLFLLIAGGSILFLYKNRIVPYFIFCCLLSFGFYYKVTDFWLILCDQQYNAVASSVNVARKFTVDDDENIIILGTGEYVAEMRYGLYNRTIDIMTDVEELNLSSDALVFTSKMQEGLDDGYWIKIDNNQYAYTKSEENYFKIVNILEE